MVNCDSGISVGSCPVSCNINTFYNLGLGYYSEQAFESMHHDAKVNIYNDFEKNLLSLLCFKAQ